MRLAEFIKNNNRKKVYLVLLNSFSNLLAPFSTLLASLLVVRLTSIELWGEYSRLILLITILSQIAAWGNKEYLSREFSKSPKDAKVLWLENLTTRILILIPIVLLVLFLPLNSHLKILTILLILVRFFLQSYESILLFRRTYTIKIIAELSALALFAGLFICYHQRFNIDRLLFLTIVLDLFKTFLIAFFTKLSYKALVFSVKPDLLKNSFPFFLLLFTSLLGSRADQINASLLLNTTEIGSYQILMNFVLILQASSNFTLQPFLKNIYRLKFVLIQKIALRLFLIGIPLAAFGVLLIHVTLFYIYQIEFDPLILLLGYLFVLPMFHYSPYIYYLFKLDKIKPVILFNIGGSLVLFSISILLFHFYKSGIFSLLLSATLVQWMLLFIYKFYTARQAFREEGEMAQA